MNTTCYAGKYDYAHFARLIYSHGYFSPERKNDTFYETIQYISFEISRFFGTIYVLTARLSIASTAMQLISISSRAHIRKRR